jgi:cobaltochelatase CobN
MDNDDMFQYLGGLSMAVRKESGKDPDVFISQQKTIGQGHIESAATTIGKELRSRYLNPKWITGMKAEKYAGGREMEKFVEYMWGWQVTVPKAIDRAKWEQTYQVYVEDKYDMELKEFFNKENPWAYQSMTARMLESIRKDYWKPEDKIKKKLAVEYAVNVVEKGVACCDHTCNNPALNQMVVNIISLPGVLSPDMVEKFKIAVEQAVGKALDKQVQERTDLLEKLKQGFNQKAKQSNQQINDQKETLKKGKDSAAVEGYKMEEVKTKDESTELTSSGIQWVASLFVIFIIGLAVYGAKRKTGN